LIDKIQLEHDHERDAPRDDNTQRLLGLFVALVPVAGLVYLIAVAVSEEPVLRSAGVVGTVCAALGAFALLKHGRGAQAARVLVWGCWLSLELQIFISNGLSSRSLMALPIVIMMAAWLLPPRSAIALGVATVLCGLALTLGEQTGLLPIYDSPSPPLLVWLATSTYVVLSSALAYYIFRGFRLRHEALKRSEEKFATAFRAGPMAMSITRLADGRCMDINDAFADLLGWRREEIVGRDALEIGKWLSPEDREAWALELRRSGRIANRESHCRTRGGVLREVQMSSVLIELDGEACALVLATDITERKRAGEKFAKVFHASPEAISITRLRDGLYLDVNEAFVEQIGWRREEVIGRTVLDIGLWPSPAARQRWVARLRRHGRVRSYEAALNAKNGRRHTALISAELFDLDGEQCVIGMLYDITEQRRVEAALRDSEARLKEAQRIGHVGSWELDLASGRVTGSDEIYRIYGRAPGSFDGTFEDFLAMVHPEDRDRLRNAWRESARFKGGFELEHRILTPAGRVRHLLVHWEIARDDAGEPLRIHGTAQDVTDQEAARQEIRRLNAELEERVQERTAELTAVNRELESFAYSISHDLRAPLRGIDGFSQMALEEYGDRLDAQGRGYLERVRAAAQRMGNLIDDILELSRVARKQMVRQEVDLSRMAGDILDEFRQAAPERAVEAHIAGGMVVQGDPQLLRVALQNLIENAWKYSSKEAAPIVEFGCREENGERVFRVRDNGVGFDMAYADRLFAPFHRLHRPEEFEGTGIGLATVARIVHRHGGRIWAESAPGQGATFHFTLAGRNGGHPAQ